MRQVGREEAIRKIDFILSQRLTPMLLRNLAQPHQRHQARAILAAAIVDALPWELLIDAPDYPADGISGAPAAG